VIALLDTSEKLETCAEELGGEVEQLFSPLTRFKDQNPDAMKAADNGGFKGLDIPAYLALLEREVHQQEMFHFITVPDIVANARRTLELFDYWFDRLEGWPLALVAQDGQENLPIPWEFISAIFIGGTTEFKMSKATVDIIRTAQAMEKWVHVGRVNDPQRWLHFEALNVDSVDGTGLSRYSHMRLAIKNRHDSGQSQLFTGTLEHEEAIA
jgi:hypothetical protein